MASISVLERSKALAQSLRREGRFDDAETVDELIQRVEQQTERSQYATTGEVAKLLGVSRQTVVNWIRRGYLPGVKLGSRLVVPRAELAAVEEVARLLDSADERLPMTPEEIDDI